MMNIQSFFDDRTATITYVVFDEESKDAIVIDPVLDYDPAASKIWTESSDEVLFFLKTHELRLHYLLETHAHADHLSGAQLIKEQFPEARIVIGERITEVQKIFKSVFGLPAGFATDGSQFDMLIKEGEPLQAGTITIEAFHTPGHTPACMTYRIEDAIFTGDAIFMPDLGTGRCDFPGGSAEDLYHSIHEVLYSLPDDTRMFVGHDYPKDRDAAWETTVGAQKEGNIALPASRSREDFVSWRNARDSTLSAPKLLFQSVQVNIDAGHLPQPSENQQRYLKIPINVFKPESTSPENLELRHANEVQK